MAYSQLDPARLQGAALTRWYLRSPADIERERQEAADQKYKDFFAPKQPPPLAAEATPVVTSAPLERAPPILWAASGPNRWIGQAVTSNSFHPNQTLAANGPQGRIAGPGAQTPPAGDDHICRACHWGGVPPLPPGGIPSFRDIPPSSPSSPSKPPEPDRKQCEQQLQSDTDICAQQPNNASKGICREGAMKRYAHCRKTGEVGTPYLFTVGRMPRR